VPALGRLVADAIERPLPFGDIAVGEHRHRRLEHGVVIPPTTATHDAPGQDPERDRSTARVALLHAPSVP